MRTSNGYPFSLCLVLLVLLSSCFSRKDREVADEPVEATETVASEPQKPTTSKPDAPAVPEVSKIPKVNVFLEVSGGMAGFMPKGGASVPATEFQKAVASLLTEVNYNQAVQNKDFYYIREQNGNSQLVKEDYSQVLKTVSAGIANPALGTELPEMLEQILKQSGKSRSVSVVISDFIYGPADKTKFNIIPQLVRGSLNQAQQNDLVISVFANRSGFYGSYHPAVKQPAKKRDLKGTKVPYYIWVIGPQEEVSLFNREVVKLQPEQQAHYGFTYPAPNFAALTKYQPKGIVYCSERKPEGECRSVTIDPKKNAPVEFEVGVDLTHLPAAVQDADYLKQHLQLTAKGISGTILSVLSVKRANINHPGMEKFSHLVRIKIEQALAPAGQLTLTLPNREAPWIGQWTTQNDNDPAADPGKTFRLNDVLAGVQSLYARTPDNIFELSITFKKYSND